MRIEDYLETKVIDSQMVNIGADDYSQCFYFEYVENGELKEAICSTYNYDYMEEIEGFIKRLHNHVGIV